MKSLNSILKITATLVFVISPLSEASADEDQDNRDTLTWAQRPAFAENEALLCQASKLGMSFTLRLYEMRKGGYALLSVKNEIGITSTNPLLWDYENKSERFTGVFKRKIQGMTVYQQVEAFFDSGYNTASVNTVLMGGPNGREVNSFLKMPCIIPH